MNNNIGTSFIKAILLFALFLACQLKSFANDSIHSSAIRTEIEVLIDSFNHQSDELHIITVITNNKQQTQLAGTTNRPKEFLSLKKNLEKNDIVFTDSVRLQSNPALGDKVYGLINVSVANLRSEPLHSAELSTQALLGTPVNVLDKKNNWLLIQTPDNYISWTEESAVNLLDQQEMNKWIAARKIVYNRNYGNSYEKADTNSQTVSDVVICNIFEYVSENSKFIQVMYPDKRIAFLKKTDCIDYNKWINLPSPTANDIIKTAKTFTGIPYLWGGTSSKGLDCSGFTKLTFLIYGVIIQRDASQQANYGFISNATTFDKLQPGNLLFFGRKDKDTDKVSITHVAIYTHNNEYIHASGMVSYNSFDSNSPIFSSYRANSFTKSSDYVSAIGTANITKVKNSIFYNKR
jgi:cell wall-associated NlpC family hydrolase